MAVLLLDTFKEMMWRVKYGPDDEYYARVDYIRQHGLPCKLTVEEDWDDLQLEVEPSPGWVHLATPWGLVNAWLRESFYHVSVTRLAHRADSAAWWRIFNRWNNLDVVLNISNVRGGASAVLDYWEGPGADEDILTLRASSPNWYSGDDLHLSM